MKLSQLKQQIEELDASYFPRESKREKDKLLITHGPELLRRLLVAEEALEKATSNLRAALDLISRIKLVLGVDLSTNDADLIVEKCRCFVARLSTAEAEREKDRQEWMDQMDEIQRKDHQLEKAINALKLAYARGHFCDDVPCPGCECGHALDKILGRIVSQEECEQFAEAYKEGKK